MDLKQYFDDHKGFGVLSTADRSGVVDAAVYSRPHVESDGSLAFIMRDRLTRANIQTNPHAIYLFREDQPGYHGIRLFLTKTAEDDNPELIESLRRRQKPDRELAGENRYVVYFKVDKALKLIGAGEVSLGI
jgi:hypothetical protein